MNGQKARTSLSPKSIIKAVFASRTTNILSLDISRQVIKISEIKKRNPLMTKYRHETQEGKEVERLRSQIYVSSLRILITLMRFVFLLLRLGTI